VSLLQLLKVKSKPVKDARRHLEKRFVALCAKRSNREELARLGFPGSRPLSKIRVRDLAVAIHRLENFADPGRAELDFEGDRREEDFKDPLTSELMYDAQAEEDALLAILTSKKNKKSGKAVAHSQEFWEIAIAVNAAFKGLLASQGQSGHICARVVPIRVEFELQKGWHVVLSQIIETLRGQLHSGDVVVLADKVLAAAQGRVAPKSILLEPDPKTVPASTLPRLANQWTERLGFTITPLHLLLADEYGDSQATVGTEDHNSVCAGLARTIFNTLGVAVDVIISDTDTGLDIRRPLIGTLTIAATPLGATRGLTLYEAMRCAVAAEFVRGHTRRIPVVVCIPAERRRHRMRIGQHRGYAGALDAAREDNLAHA
jgi:hypothetical protein